MKVMVHEPVAWREEGNVLVLLHLEHGVDQSGGVVLCRESGLYRSLEESRSEPLFPLTSDMCLLDLRPETTGGGAGTTALVVGNRDSLKLIAIFETAGFLHLRYQAFRFGNTPLSRRASA